MFLMIILRLVTVVAMKVLIRRLARLFRRGSKVRILLVPILRCILVGHVLIWLPLFEVAFGLLVPIRKSPFLLMLLLLLRSRGTIIFTPQKLLLFMLKSMALSRFRILTICCRKSRGMRFVPRFFT